jgi:hypothetical protein
MGTGLAIGTLSIDSIVVVIVVVAAAAAGAISADSATMEITSMAAPYIFFICVYVRIRNRGAQGRRSDRKRLVFTPSFLGL